MQKRNFKINKFIAIFTFLFLLCIFVKPSFAYLSSNDENLNFTIIEITPSEDVYFTNFLNKPEAWESISNMPSLMSNYVTIDKDSIQTVSDYSVIETKSLAELVSTFKANMYIENPEYAYAHIAVLNEDYENLTKVLKSFGFEVKENVIRHLMLNDSVRSMNLPFTYETSPGQFNELTGAGRTIAILDSGVDPTLLDFAGRLKFWNDTTTERIANYTDYVGHGTHVASTAAGGIKFLVGDVDKDCFVNQTDLDLCWGHINQNWLPCDWNNDGVVNFLDIVAVVSNMSKACIFKGVAPEADIRVWKVCRYDDWCSPWGCNWVGCDDDWMADAINQAVNQNVDVISMSIGGAATAAECNGRGTGAILRHFNAIQNALNHNIAVVAANGNDGPNGVAGFPACVNRVIAVGSTAKKDYQNDVYNPLTYFDSMFPYRNKLNINVNSEIVGQSSPTKSSVITDLDSIGGFRIDLFRGTHFTIQPSSWPATVNFRLESEHKDRGCFSPWNSDYGDVWWDPGTRDTSDDFWNLATQTFNNGPYIGFEMLAQNNIVTGGFLSCPGDPVDWYYAYLNAFACSGTPKVCNDFDSNRNSCENQVGCYWCGCGYTIEGSLSTCYPDKPQSECSGCTGRDVQKCYVWYGCHGTPKTCNDESRIKWPYKCGTPDTTGCTGTWTVNDIEYQNIFIKNTPGTKDFVSFFSSRGPSPNNLVKPDVTAPGEFICAAKSSQIDTGRDGSIGLEICGSSYYHAYSGTSMATPHVSGLVALLKQANPTATVNDIINVLTNTADPTGYGVNVEGFGRVNGKEAINALCDLKDRWTCNGDVRQLEDYYCPGGPCEFKITNQKNCNDYDRGYSDSTNDPAKCSGYNYISYTSANQMRDYSCSSGDCICNVIYDSYITSVAINGIVNGDAETSRNDYIYVDTDIRNTGTLQQQWWFAGIEFWKVNDYNDPWNTRSNGVYTYYNGKDKTHGNNNGVSGADCSLLNDPNSNGFLDSGETIKVRCWIPASFYGSTSGNQRIMFWVHERDLGQDAGNNGNAGNDWWTDALTRAEPANVKVKIVIPDGGYPDVINNPSRCQTYNYISYTSANQMRDYSDLSCNVNFDSYITNVCISGKCENIDNPVLYYKFDEGQGSIVHDSSANKYDGTLQEPNAIDDFEDNDFNGWTASCGPTETKIASPGYGSNYAFSIKATGSGGGCAYRNVDVVDGDRVSYICKGYGCKMCVWNGTTCLNADSSSHGYVSDWKLFSSKISGTKSNAQIFIYNDGATGHEAIFDFVTKGSIWFDGKKEKDIAFRHGLDYIKIPNNMNNLYNLSIESWIKINPFSEPRYFIIAAKTGEEWNAPDIDYDYKLISLPLGQQLAFYYRYSGGKCGRSYIKNITDGNWHHVAVTLDSTNNKITFYVDGNKSYENSGCGPLVLTSFNTRIGQMIGDMDELKIYNKVINYEDPAVLNTNYIYIDTDIKNTGINQQQLWYLGLEFWNVSNYNDPWNTRDAKGRINAYFNGKNGTYGCSAAPEGNCPSGVGCYKLSESININGFLDSGETIKVRCWVPASFYGSTSGNQRIMFWVHERDLGQDAGNNGNAGNDWWTDALTRAEPANVKVKINCRKDASDSDGGNSYTSTGTCTDYYQNGTTCKNTQYTDSCMNSNTLREYYVSGSGDSATCSYADYNCTNLGSIYYCSSGKCVYSGGGGGGGGCLVEGTKILTPDGFRKIEDIKIGDFVIGYKDGKETKAKVRAKTSHFGFWAIYNFKGSWFTETHQVYPDWNRDEVVVPLVASEKKTYTGTVYDIETETHNYIGENGALIHNFFMKIPVML